MPCRSGEAAFRSGSSSSEVRCCRLEFYYQPERGFSCTISHFLASPLLVQSDVIISLGSGGWRGRACGTPLTGSICRNSTKQSRWSWCQWASAAASSYLCTREGAPTNTRAVTRARRAAPATLLPSCTCECGCLMLSSAGLTTRRRTCAPVKVAMLRRPHCLERLAMIRGQVKESLDPVLFHEFLERHLVHQCAGGTAIWSIG